MVWIRSLLLGVPLLVASVYFAAFRSVRQTEKPSRNEIVVGVLQPVGNLNPLQPSSPRERDIQDLVFSSLLRVGGNRELRGELATEWKLTHEASLFFGNETQAAKALATIKKKEDAWPGWGLQSVEAAETEVRLSFPAEADPHAIYEILDKEFVLPVSWLRVEVDAFARAAFETFLGQSVTGGQVKRVWFESARVFELAVIGDANPVVKELDLFFEKNAERQAVVSIQGSEPFLFEPAILFNLRKDVFWHDGKPFTSVDVAFTYQAQRDEWTGLHVGRGFDRVYSVEVIDEFTVRVVYRKEYAPALWSWTAKVFPQHILDGRDAAGWAGHFSSAPVGTGPFAVESRGPGGGIVLRANEVYFGGRPPIDRIRFRVFEDPLALRIAFRTGGVDLFEADPFTARRIAERPGNEVAVGQGNACLFAGWNLERALFSDRAVRRALALAVDAEALFREVYGGGPGLALRGFPWRRDGGQILPLPHDSLKARTLFEEAGWELGPDGVLIRQGIPFSFRLRFDGGNRLHEAVAAGLSRQLRAAGVEAIPEPVHAGDLRRGLTGQGEFDAVLTATGAILPVWHPAWIEDSHFGALGLSGQRLDEAVAQLHREPNPERSRELSEELRGLVLEEQPCLFLFQSVTSAVFRSETHEVGTSGREGKADASHEKILPNGTPFHSRWMRKGMAKPAPKDKEPAK